MIFEKVCVMGLGYIGLPTASTFATHGLNVVGVDVNQAVIETLQRGEIHIHEPGLRGIVTQALSAGKLKVQMIPETADAFIISVPTPFYGEKKADLRAVRSAAEAIMPYLRKGNLVILESTSPPLTTEKVVGEILERSGLKVGEDFYLCYSPERVLPGRILIELVENARVMGGVTPESAQAGSDLYRTFVKGDIILTTATTAEMVKLMENTYRDVNIAIANEFSRLAERFGIDVWEAISIANLHPRVEILRPGPGWAAIVSVWIPWFLVEAAPDLTSLIRTAREVNDNQPHYVVSLVQRALGSDLNGKKVAVLGLAYKPDVDDLRESPAVEIARALGMVGAEVKAYEPYKPDAKLDGVVLSPTLEAALIDADAVLFLVAHQPFKILTPIQLRQKSRARILIDTVHLLDEAKWTAEGFDVFTLGVGH